MLLEDFLPSLPGFHLFYPQRSNMAPKLRALVEHVRRWMQRSSTIDEVEVFKLPELESSAQ